MKTFKQFLNTLMEALPLSTARDYSKNWDKERYADIFRRFTSDPKAYRIVLDLDTKSKAPKVKVPTVIDREVKKQGYEVEDYVSGIASKDDGKRKIKIGKLLADNPDAQKLFANDPQRQASKDAGYKIVISRHPYDIAGMSTNRGWTSCMNLMGINGHYVMSDVEGGTIIAYLVRGNDLNIKNPTGRILIKPFFNVDKPDEFILQRESQVYGTNVNGFTQKVDEWLNEVNGDKAAGVYCISPGKYVDGMDSLKYKSTSGDVKSKIPKKVEKELDKISDSLLARFELALKGDLVLTHKEIVTLVAGLDYSTLGNLASETAHDVIKLLKRPEYKDIWDDRLKMVIPNIVVMEENLFWEMPLKKQIQILEDEETVIENYNQIKKIMKNPNWKNIQDSLTFRAKFILGKTGVAGNMLSKKEWAKALSGMDADDIIEILYEGSFDILADPEFIMGLRPSKSIELITRMIDRYDYTDSQVNKLLSTPDIVDRIMRGSTSELEELLEALNNSYGIHNTVAMNLALALMEKMRSNKSMEGVYRDTIYQWLTDLPLAKPGIKKRIAEFIKQDGLGIVFQNDSTMYSAYDDVATIFGWYPTIKQMLDSLKKVKGDGAAKYMSEYFIERLERDIDKHLTTAQQTELYQDYPEIDKASKLHAARMARRRAAQKSARMKGTRGTARGG
ncbi:hypothetical protein RsoM2USA_132 [Ralstonia phage RsoM2USA]|nr:hypothetical protein RsoM2USA_132 [Ralstonia phage RsoM2USA]